MTRAANPSKAAIRIASPKYWFPLVLCAVVMVLYAPSLRFGLMWDDPLWYQVGAGRSVWELFNGIPEFQFYRPLTLLFNRLLAAPHGEVRVLAAHAVQIAAHLAAALMLLLVLPMFNLERWHVRFTALLFAVCPLSYQAIAWQAPQQPLALVILLFALWSGLLFHRRRRTELLVLSLFAYGAALLIQESAVPFALLFFWPTMTGDSRRLCRRSAWPLLYLALAVLFTLRWTTLVLHDLDPSKSRWSLKTLAYLLQGTVFPVAHIGVSRFSGWPDIWLTALLAGVLGLLVYGVWQSGARWAAFCCIWIGAGTLPVWAGLHWEYVEVGSRLLYPASPGIAGLWGAWAAWIITGTRRPARLAGAFALAVLLSVSASQWRSFQNLFKAGTGHLTQAAALLSRMPQSRLLFVNFPDRMEIPSLYPFGFWGLTLAPPVVSLADFARAQYGISGEDRSRRAPLTGARERDRWAYRVDMRGAEVDAKSLFADALWADQVFLTDYLPDGALHLQEVGHVRPAAPASAALAQFEDSALLVEAEFRADLTLRLVWRALKPLADDDTIFVHLRNMDLCNMDASPSAAAEQPDNIVAQLPPTLLELIRPISFDGDSLGGLIPAAEWTLQTEIVDIRDLAQRSPPSGRYEMHVGLYNRRTRLRHNAAAADGNHFMNDEVPLGKVVIP